VVCSSLRRAVTSLLRRRFPCSRHGFAIPFAACFNLSSPELKAAMKNPLDSIAGTIVSGVILTFVLYVFVQNFIMAGV